MSTDLAAYQPHNDLAADMDYARTISGASMLPQQYRGKPADVLVAMGLGKSMGLSPAESLYRIHVIQGRPTASAELIAANVRKAGHRLRVTGDEQRARATIVRADDPEFEFESVWDLERAKRLGLSGKDGWVKQPGTMMRWRAITEVARLACPEALYGVAYVAEEIDDERPAAPSGPRPTGLAAVQAAVKVEPEPVDVTDAEVVDDEPEPITDAQMRALHASFNDAGITDREQRLDYCRNLTGRPELDSSKALTKAEASAVLDALKSDAGLTQDGADLFADAGEGQA